MNNIICFSQEYYCASYNGLKLRSEPTLESEALGVVRFGEKVTFIEREWNEKQIKNRVGQWTLVEYNSLKGYVFSAYLSRVQISDPRTAKSVLDFIFKELDKFICNDVIYSGFQKEMDINAVPRLNDQKVFCDGSIYYQFYGNETELELLKTSSFLPNDLLNILNVYNSYTNERIEVKYETGYIGDRLIINKVEFFDDFGMECIIRNSTTELFIDYYGYPEYVNWMKILPVKNFLEFTQNTKGSDLILDFDDDGIKETCKFVKGQNGMLGISIQLSSLQNTRHLLSFVNDGNAGCVDFDWESITVRKLKLKNISFARDHQCKVELPTRLGEANLEVLHIYNPDWGLDSGYLYYFDGNTLNCCAY